MRIIAGRWKGRRLKALKGPGIRPTTDRVREAWMSALGGTIPGARVLDLFAGSGALGLEALSRGAAQCLFVEQDAAAIRALRQNIAAFRAQSRCDVRASSVMSLGPAKEPLDLILLDPPYDTGAGQVALDKMARLGWVGPASWVALETARDEELKLKAYDIEAERVVGKAKLTILRLKQEA